MLYFARGWGLIDRIAPRAGLDAAVEQAVAILLECGPEALRAAVEELPLKESVEVSIGVFGQCYLTGEPQRLMRDFVNRKR